MSESIDTTQSSGRMPLVDALQVLADLRTDEVVITSMGTTREWPKLSRHPLDFHYLPSAMGGAPPLGLGLALAKPEKHVIVFSGDGSLLMNLGSLVTIAASGADNLTVVLIDNGVYEVTGGQQTAAAAINVDYVGLAIASGIPTAVAFNDLTLWSRDAVAVLNAPGPRLISLRTEPVRASVVPPSQGPVVPRMQSFQAALNGSN
jgi:thiamine pyrophosphate-dependent acetolactate synthase large subunit-like protein